MKKKEKNQSNEFISQRQELKESKRFSLRELIDGSLFTREVVTRQIPYILFLTLLLIFYISNRYRSEKLDRDIYALEKQLKESKTESVNMTFELMNASKRSAVIDKIRQLNMDLEESVEQPYKVIVEKEE